MTAQAKTRYTLEEYFELEYNSPTRHEYINGKIVPMAYSSKPHGKIVHNLDRIIGNHLLDSDLDIYTGDRLVFVPDCNQGYYPDLVIIKQDAEVYKYKGKMEAELHPIVLIEILSDSTEDKDRQAKWNCYRKIESLQQYVMISQKIKEVEIYTRQPEPNHWQYTAYESDDATLEIAGCALTLQDIYHKVTLPQPEANTDETQEVT